MLIGPHIVTRTFFKFYRTHIYIYMLTGPLIRFVLDALIDLRQEKEREGTDEGTRMTWTKKGREAVVVIEEVKEAIETVRVIDTGTGIGTGTRNGVVKEMVKEPTAVIDMMVQMADMVTRIVTARGTETTRIVIAGAREATIMKDLSVVRTTESKGKNQKHLTTILLLLHYLRRRHLLAYPRLRLRVIVPLQFVHLTEETATCERSTTIHQEAKEVDVMVAVMSMMTIL